MKPGLRPYWDLLAGYVRPERRLFVLLSILLLTRIGLQLVSPQILASFIDGATSVASATSAVPATSVAPVTGAAPAAAQTGGQMDPLLRTGLLFLIVAIVQQAVTVGVAYVGKDLGWKTTNALRADLALHCLRLDMSFHNARTPGEMIERIDGDVNTLSNFFSQFVVQIVGNAILVVGVLFLLSRADWRAGLAMTGFSVITLLVVGRLQGFGSSLWKERRQAISDLFGFLEERLAGTEDVRSSGATAYVMHRFYELLRVAHQTLVRAGTIGAGITVNTADILFALGSVTALAIGATLYSGGLLTIGTVYLILHYTQMLMWPIRQVTRQVQDLQRAGAGVTRVQEILDIESRLGPSLAAGDPLPAAAARAAGTATYPRLPEGPLGIAFEDVSFGYEKAQEGENGVGKEMVLHGLSLDLAPGKTLGLLGRTGSGKTTLCRLLFRLYDPDAGRVCFSVSWDNSSAAPGETMIDLRALPLAALRRRVGIVTQEIQLFEASVRDNLTLFDKSIPDTRIIAAIHTLGMGDWLDSLGQGLDTELAPGGGGLSAGEAQLLALTRIFLQDPGLIILDEASSRLDPATEGLLEQAIDRLLENRTAIVIAHRLHTVQRADEILILEDGAILEKGARTDLARDPNSRFYSLLQTGLEEVLV